MNPISVGEKDPLDRETPAWFDAAKLGIFVVWSAGAIPAFAPLVPLHEIPEDGDGTRTLRRLPYAHEYQNTMLLPGSATQRHHQRTYGELPYEAFVERFRDELIPRFDPEPVADLIARSGARYAVHYVRFNDGFLPWPSAHPNPHRANWQSQRDVVGELAAAIRARGVRAGIGYPGGMDWTFTGLPTRNAPDMYAAIPQSPEYVAYADAHWRELIDRYAPDVLWNDYGWPRDGDPAALIRHYLERVPDGVVNNRFFQDRIEVLEPHPVYSDFVTPEYYDRRDYAGKWETIRALGASFGYNREDSERTYLSAERLVHEFVDVVARGGNLLLGIGLTATGEVPWAQAQRLLALGWWLRVNGEAIYGTRPWTRAAGMTDHAVGVRYTATEQAVHAIVLGTPSTDEVVVDVRLDEGAEVTLAGRPGALPWVDGATGVRVTLPEPPDEQPAISLRLAPASAVRPLEETA
jgi:alpha-L-fucosidase